MISEQLYQFNLARRRLEREGIPYTITTEVVEGHGVETFDLAAVAPAGDTDDPDNGWFLIQSTVPFGERLISGPWIGGEID